MSSNGHYISFDYSEIIPLVDKLATADRNFRDEIPEIMEAIGNEFLDTVQEEIIKNKNIDTSRLLQSFEKDATGNIWVMSSDGLTLEVGTNIEYADYVNSGHWTNPKGQSGRWIPGTWSGDKFNYDPSAKTGMYLKQQYIEGSHYFDTAEKIISKVGYDIIDAALGKWLDKYFGNL